MSWSKSFWGWLKEFFRVGRPRRENPWTRRKKEKPEEDEDE